MARLVSIGVTLGGDAIARWLEANLESVGCIEVAADGIFARPTPFLGWLGTTFPLVLRATGISIGSPERLDDDTLSSLRALTAAANARHVVYPLGYDTAGGLALPVHLPIWYTPQSLDEAVDRLSTATAACGRPALVEPPAALLRMPGSLSEVEFLTGLCQRAGARLLIDVTSLLVLGRNRGLAPETWLAGLPAGLVAAVRIAGSSLRGGRWHRDPEAPIDEAAWVLLERLTAEWHPELVLVEPASATEDGELGQLLVRLGRLPSRRAALQSRRGGGADQPRLFELRGAAGGGPLAGRTEQRSVVASRSDATLAKAEAPPAVGDAVVPAADVALFVLDDEGVFFSGSRRELIRFNTAATFVWCHVDERAGVPAIVAAYRNAFGVGEGEAHRHVATILRHWYGCGYIDDPGPLPAADPVAPATALAQLLTHPGLRAAFRRSPREIAERLGVAAADAHLIAGLDADDLDLQAEELLRAAAARQADRAVPTDIAGRRRPAPPGARVYRLLSTSVAIVADARVGDRIDAALAHLAGEAADADIVLEVRASSSGWILLDGARIVAGDLDERGVVPWVKQFVRQAAVEREPFLVSLHAGVVSLGGGCVLLPAAAGSGKSTLTAGLVHAGATYFSDEIALLDEGTLEIRPVPLSFTVKDGSLAPLRPLYPALDASSVHVREDHVRVRYLPPPPASLPRVEHEAARWIVFPRYAAAGATALRALGRPDAFQRLLREAFVRRDRLDRHAAESLVRWMRSVDCYELEFSSLEKAVELVRGLAAGAGAVIPAD